MKRVPEMSLIVWVFIFTSLHANLNVKTANELCKNQKRKLT